MPQAQHAVKAVYRFGHGRKRSDRRARYRSGQRGFDSAHGRAQFRAGVCARGHGKTRDRFGRGFRGEAGNTSAVKKNLPYFRPASPAYGRLARAVPYGGKFR